MKNKSHTILVPHQSSWKDKFEEEKIELQKIFGGKAITIEHIGSTSISGFDRYPKIKTLFTPRLVV